ncbi:GAF domain-containing protein [Aquihabitans sp. McL0605]|uniref:GAF domain-containing protein n=1 Tax=Aquihabitans sp. McL0605 TaxID=3415671 RepID=UPI003CF9BA82
MSDDTAAARPLTLADLRGCFEGTVPAVLCTSSAEGIPNVTFLSKVRQAGPGRIVVSNQFFSKTARNIVEHPQASLLLVDAETHDEYRLAITYERTERRGPLFDQLRDEVEAIAALTGMQDVFHLQAADVYRVDHLEIVNRRSPTPPATAPARPDAAQGLGELCARLSRCADLDSLVRVAIDGLADLLGHQHGMLLLADEDGKHLFTIASRGYDTEGIGAEVPIGEGIVGMAAAQCAPLRVGNLRQMTKYSQTVRRSFEESGTIGPGREVPMSGLELADSRMAVPAMALGQLVGVVMVESDRSGAFSDADEATLQVVASLLGSAVETVRAEERAVEARATGPAVRPAAPETATVTHVRFFPVDGSTFLDGDYLIKGVAGRILWSLLRQHTDEGRVDFTNREVRLDPSLDLPDFRDNFESRLILLKRRLDERDAPVRIQKTGRGRFRLDATTALRLETMGAPD